jgi:hypothetical protein
MDGVIFLFVIIVLIPLADVINGSGSSCVHRHYYPWTVQYLNGRRPHQKLKGVADGS